jgi:hypothetical protein
MAFDSHVEHWIACDVPGCVSKIDCDESYRPKTGGMLGWVTVQHHTPDSLLVHICDRHVTSRAIANLEGVVRAHFEPPPF